MQHTNTSSTSGGSTTSLFYRDLGARWLTTRSKKGIRRSNKNRPTLSKAPIYGWWRPAWNLSFEERVGNVASYWRRANMKQYPITRATRNGEAQPFRFTPPDPRRHDATLAAAKGNSRASARAAARRRGCRPGSHIRHPAAQSRLAPAGGATGAPLNRPGDHAGDAPGPARRAAGRRRRPGVSFVSPDRRLKRRGCSCCLDIERPCAVPVDPGFDGPTRTDGFRIPPAVDHPAGADRPGRARGEPGSRGCRIGPFRLSFRLSLDYTSIHVVRSPQSWLRTQLPIPVLVALPLLHRHDRKHMESWICIWITNFALSFTPPVAAAASDPASASASASAAVASASAAAPTWWAGTRPFRHSGDRQ